MTPLGFARAVDGLGAESGNCGGPDANQHVYHGPSTKPAGRRGRQILL